MFRVDTIDRIFFLAAQTATEKESWIGHIGRQMVRPTVIKEYSDDELWQGCLSEMIQEQNGPKKKDQETSWQSKNVVLQQQQLAWSFSGGTLEANEMFLIDWPSF